MAAPPLGPFSSDDISAFLMQFGYTANPAGLVGQYSGDFTFESDSLAGCQRNRGSQGRSSPIIRFGLPSAVNSMACLHNGR